eukprot:scaffold46961_cov81-Phaeocystis_antarctica.AAC.2
MERDSMGGPVRPAAHLGQLGWVGRWLGRVGGRGGVARAAGGAGGALLRRGGCDDQRAGLPLRLCLPRAGGRGHRGLASDLARRAALPPHRPADRRAVPLAVGRMRLRRAAAALLRPPRLLTNLLTNLLPYSLAYRRAAAALLRPPRLLTN